MATVGQVNAALSPSYTSSPPHLSSKFATTAWDISEHVLYTVTTGAQSAPTPHLKSLSVATLTILNTVQGAKSNQKPLKQLAYAAYNLVQAVYDVYNEMHKTATGQVYESETFSSDVTVNKHVEDLVRSDLKVIKNFKVLLERALENFQLQVTATMRNTVLHVAAKQEAMEKEAAHRHDVIRAGLQAIQDEFEQQDNQRATYIDSDSPTLSGPSSGPFPAAVSSPASPMFPRASSSRNPYGSRNPFVPARSISVNNIAGDYHSVHEVDSSKRENFGNVYNNDSSRSTFPRGMGTRS